MAEQELEDVLKASDIRSFTNTVFWKFYKKELEIILQNAMSKMIIETDSVELYRFQGRIEAVRDLIIMPDKWIDSLEETIVEEKPEND